MKTKGNVFRGKCHFTVDYNDLESLMHKIRMWREFGHKSRGFYCDEHQAYHIIIGPARKKPSKK